MEDFITLATPDFSPSPFSLTSPMTCELTPSPLQSKSNKKKWPRILLWKDNDRTGKYSDLIKRAFPSLIFLEQEQHPIARQQSVIDNMFKKARHFHCQRSLLLIIQYMDTHLFNFEHNIFHEQPSLESVLPEHVRKSLSQHEAAYCIDALGILYDMYKNINL